MTIPELVKRGWTFPHLWDSKLGVFYVWAKKLSWGIRSEAFFSSDWDRAHEKARAWAAEEERIIGMPDTIPAPPLSESHAAE